MRLYAVSVAAQRNNEIGLQTAIVALPDDAAIEAAGAEVAETIFAIAEGWDRHYSNAVELIQDFSLDPYRLTWRLEEARDG